MRSKILYIFPVFLICILFFAGCSTVNYSLLIKSDGSIEEEVSVTLMPQEMPEIDCEALLTEIDVIMQNWIDNKQQMFLIEGVSFEKKKISDNPQSPTVYLKITYVDSNAYSKAWGIDETNQTNSYWEYGIFKDKYIVYKGKTEFAGSLQTEMAKSLENWFAVNYPNFEYNFSDIIGTYVRYYPSSVCPTTSDENGATFNSPSLDYGFCYWVFDFNNTDFEITMYYEVVSARNRANWFLVALGITAILGIILYFSLRTPKNQIKSGDNNSDIIKDENNEIPSVNPEVISNNKE